MNNTNKGYNKNLQNIARQNKKNMTKSAACLWKYVLSNGQVLGYKFRRERPILNYIADFCCLELNLVIEVDGYTHQTEEAQENDLARDLKLKEIGLTTLRFSSWEVLNRIEDVHTSIENWIFENGFNAKVNPTSS